MRRKLTEEEKNIKAEAEKVERIRFSLEQSLKDLRRHRINTPTIQRKIGDRVHLGNLDSIIITEILDDGKIYLVDITGTNNNYGRPFQYKERRYIAWHDCETYKTSEEISNTPKFSDYEYRRPTFMNTSITTLMFYYRNGMNMNPDYQRDYVWEIEDKRKLIGSMLAQIDIGKFTIVKRPHSQWKNDDIFCEIIDGKQRLQAIVDFIEGRFDYKGILFRYMHPQDRHYIEDCPILLAELPEETTEKQKLEHFLRVNTTGKVVSEEHLNKVRKLLESL
jgi:hypothetical protein